MAGNCFNVCFLCGGSSGQRKFQLDFDIEHGFSGNLVWRGLFENAGFVVSVRFASDVELDAGRDFRHRSQWSEKYYNRAADARN